MTKSRDLKSEMFKRQASRPYNKTRATQQVNANWRFWGARTL